MIAALGVGAAESSIYCTKVILGRNVMQTANDAFKAQTSSSEKAVQQYQKLVLGGANQVGVVKNWVAP